MENVCCFRSKELVSKSLQHPFAYPWTRLFNTQSRFLPKNRISVETCFLETAYMSQYEMGVARTMYGENGKTI
jgi:hypothetical protein